MKRVTLKDRREVEIDIWDNRQIQEYINLVNLPTEKTGKNLHYKGLSFFGPSFIKDRYEEDVVYSNEKEISRLEEQEIKGEVNSDYDRNIVAISDGEIVGISSFLWNKERYEFWSYYIRFISVKQDWKGVGIGTNLIKRLNEPCFMWNKILMLPRHYEKEGEKYLIKIINRELTGEHFAIVPNYYGGDTPKKPGIYNLCGKPVDNVGKIRTY